MQKLGSVVKQLEELIPMLGAASEPGKAVLDALKTLVKLVPAGSTTPASERAQIEKMAMQNTQQNQQMKMMQQQKAQGGQQPPAQAAA